MKLLFKQRFFSWFDSYDIYDEYKTIVSMENNEIAATFPSFYISFIAEQGVCVVYGNSADRKLIA